ncbi:LOW QUALITY PROTEIN: U-box domain-containing protein 54 [Arachis stenosperma]|uniref:LOW QUALITY PROTEIN: U-box domain-containing protein 54 n=1 Tax=Arachis stenosperma TaxID=217475 RepID=UPI0025AB90DA|nr:LOW QUALITY PROTEIN: U-box domain-containing protein 54 [Arachis stenosperma]
MSSATLLTESLHSMHQSSSDEGAKSTMGSSQMFSDYYGIITSSSSEIVEIEEEEEQDMKTSKLYLNNDAPKTMSRISEGKSSEEEESVYVAVGKSETSMEALTWTLKNLATTSSTMLYLIHVFPEIKHIPNPLGMGMIPKSQVSGEQVESYMAQERAKRRNLLHKFLQTCSACKVKVDTILIESDFVAKAILDLIPILHITKLVLGLNKSQLRKLRSRKGNGIADQVLQSAPEMCKVRIVCEGKEISENITGSGLGSITLSFSSCHFHAP